MVTVGEVVAEVEESVDTSVSEGSTLFGGKVENDVPLVV
jgi:hypothetical protein